MKTSEIDHLSHLAKLHFSNEEKAQLNNDLAEIVNLLNNISSCNTNNSQPLTHPLELTQGLREDVITEGKLSAEQAGKTDAKGFYQAPKTVDN